jgi:MGT family glycosyltransferase
MATIAMPHIGYVSHLGSAARLGAVFVGQGHRVIAWAPEGFAEQIRSTGAEFRCDEGPPLRRTLTSPQALAAALGEHTITRTEAFVEELDGEGVDLVVHDYHVLWGRVAGDFLGLPRIVSSPLFPGTERNLAPFDPPAPELARRPGMLEAIATAVAAVGRCRETIGRRWGIDIGDWRQALVSDAERTVRFTTEAITGRPPEPGNAYVGPLLAPPAPAPPPGVRPFVYATLGTVFNFSRPTFEMLLAALADLPATALLTTGGGPVVPSQLTVPPAHVTVVPYVDDGAGMAATADVMITHAGHASVHEALLGGTPMVCLPQGADQLHWAERVAVLGAGLIAAPRADSVTAAVEALLADGRYRARAAAIGQELVGYPGESRVAALLGEI